MKRLFSAFVGLSLCLAPVAQVLASCCPLVETIAAEAVDVAPCHGDMAKAEASGTPSDSTQMDCAHTAGCCSAVSASLTAMLVVPVTVSGAAEFFAAPTGTLPERVSRLERPPIRI